MCFERSFRIIHRSRQDRRIGLMKKSPRPALLNISTNDARCSSINLQLIGTCDGNNMAMGHFQPMAVEDVTAELINDKVKIGSSHIH